VSSSLSVATNGTRRDVTFRQRAHRWIQYLPALVFAASLCYVTAYRPYNNGPAIRSDGQGYHIWTFALKKWDFRFCEYQRLGYAIPTGFSDRCIVKWPPGVALFRFPVMAWFVDVENHGSFSAGEHWVSLIFGACLALAIYLIGLNVLERLQVAAFEAQAILFALFFGTGLFHYATYDNGFSHIYSAFGSMVLVWQLVRVMANAREHTWDAPLAGLLALFMILFRNTNGLILLFSGVLVAIVPSPSWNKRRLLRAVGIGAVIGLAIQLSYNRYASGHLSLSSYVGESFMWDRPMIRSVLFSYERGLFTYYPVMLFVLVLGLWRRPSRAFTFGVASLVFVYATLYGFWHSWFLGGGFGHRGFVELAPWMVPAFGLALADIRQPTTRRWILVAASLTVFVPLQVMLGYWRGSFPFEHAGPVYWSHVFGEPGAWLLASGIGLFVLTEKLTVSPLPAPSQDNQPPVGSTSSIVSLSPWRVAPVVILTFALACAVRASGIDRHFWLFADQIRDWSIALGPYDDLPLYGMSAGGQGDLSGPAFYRILWLIRVGIGPWFQNLPHAAGVGLTLLQSAVDALLLAAVWKRSRSVWVATAAVLLLVTAPVDLSLAPTISSVVVASILAKAATALILLDWPQASVARAAITAAIAWSAVEAFGSALFVAIGVFVALIINQALRRDWRALWQRSAAIVGVMIALQIPSVTARLVGTSGAPMRVVASAGMDSGSAGGQPRVAAGASYVEATTRIQDVGWDPKTTGWMLIGFAVALAVRWRREAGVLAIILVPQLAALAGDGLRVGEVSASYYLPLMPAAILTVLLGITALTIRPLKALAIIVLLAGIVRVVPGRMSAASTMFKMPTYGALVTGSREILERQQPIRSIETRFDSDSPPDASFVFRILGGRLDPTSEWRAVILPDGRVIFSE
jgi:hypothetical protein